jgi:hypothetical protein
MWYLALLALPLAWHGLGALLHHLSTRRSTILNELPALGTARKDGKLRGTAVVAGGRCVVRLPLLSLSTCLT